GRPQRGPVFRKTVLPAGRRSFDEAVKKVVESLPLAECLEADAKLQGLIERQFKNLNDLCLNGRQHFRPLTKEFAALLQGWLEARSSKISVAQLYLEQRENEREVLTDFVVAHEESVPDLEGKQGSPTAVLSFVSVPADEPGERLQAL